MLLWVVNRSLAMLGYSQATGGFSMGAGGRIRIHSRKTGILVVERATLDASYQVTHNSPVIGPTGAQTSITVVATGSWTYHKSI